MSLISNKVDLIIEAARFKPNGQVEKVRAYMRRGPTFSDCILISRTELIDIIQNGKRVATGKRISGLASTFKELTPLYLFQKDNPILATSKSRYSERDFFNDVPSL
jgi:hypothetical protein